MKFGFINGTVLGNYNTKTLYKAIEDLQDSLDTNGQTLIYFLETGETSNYNACFCTYMSFRNKYNVTSSTNYQLFREVDTQNIFKCRCSSYFVILTWSFSNVYKLFSV